MGARQIIAVTITFWKSNKNWQKCLAGAYLSSRKEITYIDISSWMDNFTTVHINICILFSLKWCLTHAWMRSTAPPYLHFDPAMMFASIEITVHARVSAPHTYVTKHTSQNMCNEWLEKKVFEFMFFEFWHFVK